MERRSDLAHTSTTLHLKFPCRATEYSLGSEHRVIVARLLPLSHDSLCLPCSALVPLAEEPRDVLQPPPNALLTRTGLIPPQTPSTSMGLSLKIKPFDTDESQFLSLSMEEVPTAAPPSPPPRTTRSRTWWVRDSSRWQQSPVLVCVLAPE